MMNCKYLSPDKDKCPRKRLSSSDYCILHTPKDSASHRVFLKFVACLRKLHKNKDGNWLGFRFPSGIAINELNIDYPIDLRWAEVEDVSLNKMTFEKEVNLAGSRFKGEVKFQNITFNGAVNFSRATFFADVSFFAYFNKGADFTSCDFNNRVSFGGSFDAECSFNQCTFRDAVTFRGGRDITVCVGTSTSPSVSKIRRLFTSEVHFQDVDFRRPNKVKFIGVDLFNAHLVGTDMRGVLMYDVNFYQSVLKRQGLYDEVYLNASTDTDFKAYIIPRIEEGYRNIRLALEENKNYQSATDFYIGEMEIRRKRKDFLRREFFSIEAWYRALSLYGSSPLRATRVFVLFLLLHLGSSILITANISQTVMPDMTPQSALLPFCSKTIIEYLVNSISVLTLWRGENVISNGIWSSVLDTIFRIIGPLQVALIVMAMRTRIKRH
jgi:uncharacterized protein YjbI with pentapeptide repeats